MPGLTRNEFYSRKDRPILLIYAKATTELGNLGMTGLLFSMKLKGKLPKQVAVQGVHYESITSGLSLFKGGSTTAAQEMVEFVTEAVNRNPRTKIFLCGYSQGAMIVRKALWRLPQQFRGAISGVILFGDALKFCGETVPPEVAQKTLNKRLPFDWAIVGLVTITHFLYPFFSYGEAARFIKDHAA